MKATDAETVEKIIELREAGFSRAEIAEALHVSTATVARVIAAPRAKGMKPEQVRRALVALVKQKRCVRCGEQRRVFMEISRLCPECDVLDAVRRGVIVCEGGNDEPVDRSA